MLPIHEYKSQIMTALRSSQVVVLRAETGSGKSTQIPQFINEMGKSCIIMQPRRFAATSLAKRVANEMNSKIGDIVGYAHRNEQLYSRNTQVLFVTDGLALVRELSHKTHWDYHILDELHEFNKNQEVLLALFAQQAKVDKNFRLVIMSATIDLDRLSTYFDDIVTISLIGRCFPVIEEKPSQLHDNRFANIAADCHKFASGKQNVLVFLPGKPEIEEVKGYLTKKLGNYEVLSLHGEMNPADQDLVYNTYPMGKVVLATNIAQTSVTIPDIDVAIDSGLVKINRMVNDVDRLDVCNITHSCVQQRKGRVGRTKPGIYVWHGVNRESLEAYIQPEIFRVRLDGTCLNLADAGINPMELDFYHQPDKSKLEEAMFFLKKNGLIESENGIHLTEIGERVAKMPCTPSHGLMILEGERLGVLDDIVTIVSILEYGKNGKITFDHKTEYGFVSKWKQFLTQNDSDIIAQLDVFRAAAKIAKHELNNNGISKAYWDVIEGKKALIRQMRMNVPVGTFVGTERNNKLIKAILAGSKDHIWEKEWYYKHIEMPYKYGMRQMDKFSIVKSGAKRVIAIPIDRVTKDGRTFKLLVNVTNLPV